MSICKSCSFASFVLYYQVPQTPLVIKCVFSALKEQLVKTAQHMEQYKQLAATSEQTLDEHNKVNKFILWFKNIQAKIVLV